MRLLILVADEQNLLETIVSRCQLIRFSPVGEASIRDILVQRGVEPERAARLARLGQGSIAAALRWAEEEGLEELRDRGLRPGPRLWPRARRNRGIQMCGTDRKKSRPDDRAC